MTSDLLARLNDDIEQLTKMVQQAQFAGAETDVRVKSQSILLADLCEAVDAIRALSSPDHASEYDRGVRDGIDQALEIATGQAGLMADLALEGLPENARVREAMEAALTRFADTLRVTLSDLSMSSPDHADAGKVEGDGWSMSPPKFHRYPYFVENIGGKWCLCKHYGNGASHTISMHETAREARDAAPSEGAE